ncbi:MAG: cupin domain-containing protein [Gemmatimonadota bacterium]|nr:cupin domain-containing protein [Gemmatimonadota bacterium]
MRNRRIDRYRRATAAQTRPTIVRGVPLLGWLLLAITGCKPEPASTNRDPASVPPSTWLRADALEWEPARGALPAGMSIAVLQGDPNGTGAYTLRASLPNGYLFPSHRHATDQQITVIAGTFLFAQGERFDFVRLRAHRPGDFLTAPAAGAHFGGAEGETVVQFHGIGPFDPQVVDPFVPEAVLGFDADSAPYGSRTGRTYAIIR